MCMISFQRNVIISQNSGMYMGVAFFPMPKMPFFGIHCPST